uniref:Protein kinase domain-containing protein n=1 Tax=Oryza meridionalis TaxID=40149 RepID=A0A0E0DD43_9ORYZ
MVVEWAVRNASNCVEAQKDRDSYTCVSSNSVCVNLSSEPGYICNCTRGYQGNPYLLDGCQGLVTYVFKGLFGFFGWEVEGNVGFTLYERGQIETATNNFNKAQIVGEGGQGTVYRAEIDGTIVAIKRCKEIDESRKMDFVEELIILCHVNHSNIVRLLGCCLQFEHPILHGGVKPANILLTEELVVKVSDFGCSKIDEKTQVVPKGTPGYLDPD